MARRSKNHHFVPKVLQRRFVADQDRIWYSERDSGDRFCPPRLRNIQKTFRIKNYYTILRGNEPSDLVETDYYGKIDDFLGKILPQVEKAFEVGRPPSFSGKSLLGIRWTVMGMTMRTPEFVKQFDEISIGKEIVESELAKFPGSLETDERLNLLSDLKSRNRLRDIGRDVRVRSVITPSKKVDAELEDFSVRWAVSERRPSFILSSLIAYRIGNGGSNGLSNPNMEIWMPISPKIALVLLRDPMNTIPLVFSEDSDHVRQINEYALANSRQVASHSVKLLESLTGVRASAHSSS